MKTIFVEKCNKNTTVSKYILNIFPNLNRSILFKALRNKDIKLNERRISKDVFVNINDKLDIYIADELLYNLPKKLDIIYEDDNILVVYKPQGILSNDNNNKNNEPTLEKLVKNYYNEAKICHRLDRNTGGLLIFAKNDNSYNELLIAFKNGYINKKYIAYVNNCCFKSKHEILKGYIYTDKVKGISKIYDKKDEKAKNSTNLKEIITEYKVMYENKLEDYAVLEVTIHTGKTHQIRSHLNFISHALIGDSKYGKNEVNKKFKVYKQLLFAYSYSFNFPNASILNYLNNVTITLDDKYYNNKLGSDIYYGNRK